MDEILIFGTPCQGMIGVFGLNSETHVLFGFHRDPHEFPWNHSQKGEPGFLKGLYLNEYLLKSSEATIFQFFSRRYYRVRVKFDMEPEHGYYCKI